VTHSSTEASDVTADLAARAALWLFVLLSCIYTLASSGRIRTADEYMQFFQAQSLVERGSTTVPQAVHFEDFYGTFDLHGRPRAPYPAGQALMAAPLLDSARFVLAHLPGVPQREETLFYVQVFGAVLTSAVCAAGAMALFFLTLSRLGVSPENALLTTICVALGTLLFPYSGYFFSEPFTTLVLMAAVYEVARNRRLDTRSAVVAGVLLAFAIWIRPTMGLAAPIFAAAILLRERAAALRSTMIVVILPVLSGLAYLLWNKIIFGHALEFGYPKVAEMGKQLNSFQTPFYVGLRGFLFSWGKSIFIYLPPVLLAIFAIPRLWRRDRAIATLAAGLPLTYLAFYMTYTQWEGGLCPGPRYLLPFLCVTCLALGPLLEAGHQRFRRMLLILGGLGFLVQVITYAVSFLEDQAVGAYYDSHFDYRMSYNPLVSQTERLIAYIKGKPAPLGLGFDRWFVFLHKLGISLSIEIVLAIVPIVVMVVAIVRLRNALLQMRYSEMIVIEAPALQPHPLP